MTTPPTLRVVAREKNWMAFAQLLDAAMAEPPRYGLSDAGAVRAAVARLRRQQPSSLVPAMKAMEYLRERRPEVLERAEAPVGCAQVRLLARLAELAPEAAAAVEDRVLRGEVRGADLRAMIETETRRTADNA